METRMGPTRAAGPAIPPLPSPHRVKKKNKKQHNNTTKQQNPTIIIKKKGIRGARASAAAPRRGPLAPRGAPRRRANGAGGGSGGPAAARRSLRRPAAVRLATWAGANLLGGWPAPSCWVALASWARPARFGRRARASSAPERCEARPAKRGGSSARRLGAAGFGSLSGLLSLSLSRSRSRSPPTAGGEEGGPGAARALRGGEAGRARPSPAGRGCAPLGGEDDGAGAGAKMGAPNPPAGAEEEGGREKKKWYELHRRNIKVGRRVVPPLCPPPLPGSSAPARY